MSLPAMRERAVPATREAEVPRTSDAAAARRAALVGSVGAVALLALWDLARAVGRGTASATAADHVAMLVVSIGAGSLVLVPLLFARFEVARLVRPRGRRWHFAAGLLDGAVLALFWINGELRRGIAIEELAVIMAVGSLLLATARAIAAGRPRLVAVGAALAAAAAIGMGELLPWKQMYQTRLGFDLVAAAGLSHLLARVHPVPARRTMWVALGAVILSVIAAEPLLRSSEGTRWLLHHRSAHVRGWVMPFLAVADLDGDGAANVLGGRDCDESRSDVGPAESEVLGDGVDQNCEGGDGAEPAAPLGREPDGSAEGADVLVISIDALRWDLLDEIPRIREALGPHAVFERAVSPGSRTIDALSAVLRGRAVRGVHLAPSSVSPQNLPVDDTHPTLASLLVDQGYRAVMVPTHRYLDGPTGVFAGFEVLEPERFDLVRDAPYGIGRPRPIVRADRALGRLGEGIAEADGPYVAWVHLMETHDPYHWGDGHGPGTLEGLRKSVGHLDPIVADFITRWRSARNRPTIVSILGDHGEEFHEHGGRYHASTVYAEQVRVTWLLSGPGVPAERVDAPVSTAMLSPTVLDLLGLPPPEDFTERSALACLRDASRCPDLAVSEIRDDLRISVGYTDARWRLVYDPVNRVEELFDSDEDPFEQRDRSTERAAVLEDLRTRARRWDERH